MAFDWTKVDGYREDMTAEEKLNLLDSIEEREEPSKDEPPADGRRYILKDQFDKVASELAKAKKDLRSKMTEDEQKEADRQAEAEAMMEELKTLRREKALSSHKASFLSQGYEDALAEEAATALVDGDTDMVFAAMRKHFITYEKQLRAQILKETPAPMAGTDPTKDEKERLEMQRLRESFGLH